MRKFPWTTGHGRQALSHELRGLLDQITTSSRPAAESRLRATPGTGVAREPGRESLLATLGQAVLREAAARAAEDRPWTAGLHGRFHVCPHRWTQAPLAPREEGA